MKQVFVAIFVVASLGVSASTSRTCFCLLPELKDSFKDARSVFLGETIQIDEPETLDQNAPFIERAFKIKFKVVRSWKGVPTSGSEFTILWLTNCNECLALPNINEQYLVFAYPLSDSDTWSVVGMCNRTVGARKDSKLSIPEINPERDMKYLDLITGRAFKVGPPRYRRSG